MLCYREIRESDWPEILKIQKECYTQEFMEDLDSLQSRWIFSGDSCFVAEKDNAVIGYALSHPWHENDSPVLNLPLQLLPESDLLYIHDIAISRVSRRMGAANLLIKELIFHSEKNNFTLLALTAVQGNHTFWEKYGFRIVKNAGELKGYGDNAFYMKREN